MMRVIHLMCKSISKSAFFHLQEYCQD